MPASPSDSASTSSALSFVRRASDVEELRSLVAASGDRASIIAKIERPEALDDIDAILDAADGIMVARGDLGVEMPPQKVPLIQIQLTDLARAKAKPVIVATQMLESMVEKPRPTRAEVSDVALAVRSGADAVMLSAESATGKYPVPGRRDDGHRRPRDRGLSLARGRLPRALAESGLRGPHAGGGRSRESDGPAVAGHAGAGDRRDLEERPHRSGHERVAARGADRRDLPRPRSTCRKTGVLWGIIPRLVEEKEFERPEDLARRLARDLGLGVEGQNVLLVRGFGNDPSIAVVTI